MADPGTRSPESGGQLGRRALRWWALMIAFVVGLFAGAVAVGILASDTPAPPGGEGAVATDQGGAAPTSEAPAGATGELVVNDACLRAINAAQDTLDVVEDIGEAISGFNAARLDEIVRRLQPLERRLTENVAACEVEGRLPPTSSEGSAEPDSTSPTEGPRTVPESSSPSTASPTD